MGKRPYYIIQYVREYDGYDSEVLYIGSNYKAALKRYEIMYEYMRQTDYIENGVDPEDIEGELRLPDKPLEPNQGVYSYLGDGDCYWTTIGLLCRNTECFNKSNHEAYYQRLVPNAKH